MAHRELALDLDQGVVTRGIAVIGPVTLQLEVGEQLALTGPNGAGKSSLLLAIAGLLPVQSGTLSIAGQSIASGADGAEPWQRGIGWMGQERGLWPHLSIEKQCRLVGGKKRELEPRIVALAEQLAISDRLQRFPAQLSGGEAQRAELLRAVIIPGRLLLLDEPFSAQNQDGRQRMQALLDLLCTEGSSVLLASHEVPEDWASCSIESN